MNIDISDDDNLKVPSPRSDRPQSTRSDISEYDSVGEMFAAELQDEVPISIDTGDLVQISEPEDALVTPMNSPEVPDQVVQEPVGKLADLFDDLGNDDNTDDFFGEEEEEEEVQSAAAPIELKEPIQEEAKKDISEDEPVKEEEPVQNEPMKEQLVEIEQPIKEEPKKEEPIKVETPEESTVVPPPVQENIDEDDDVIEFDEPENATAKVETPLENSDAIENAAAETKEDTGLHAEEPTNAEEDQSADVALAEEPENADLTNIVEEPDDDDNANVEEPKSADVDLAAEEPEHPIDPVLDLTISDTTPEKSSEDFVDVQPKAALEDMAEPVVLDNPIEKVEELRDPSPDLKLFLVSEDGRASVRLNPADAASLQQYVKEDYSSGLADVEETDRERKIIHQVLQM